MRTKAHTSGRRCHRVLALMALIAIITAASGQLRADTGTCGGQMLTLPFTDVSAGNVFFCSIAEAFFSGLTNGTSATTYGPSANVPREQMAAFITRTLDQSLKRGSRRAALDQYWTTQTGNNLALTSVGSLPRLVQSDGPDLWVTNNGSSTVSRRADSCYKHGQHLIVAGHGFYTHWNVLYRVKCVSVWSLQRRAELLDHPRRR